VLASCDGKEDGVVEDDGDDGVEDIVCAVLIDCSLLLLVMLG